GTPLRAWLAGVVRNLARFRARGETRRVAREEGFAKPERQEDPALAVERLEMQEALLRSVRELAEPYRTTIVLRFLEGLAPDEIAARTGVPLRTVHTRTSRALAILRERLDRRSGGPREAWMSAWIPLLSKPAPAWPWIVAMDVKVKIAIAGALLVGVFAGWRALAHREEPVASGPSSLAQAASTEPAAPSPS